MNIENLNFDKQNPTDTSNGDLIIRHGFLSDLNTYSSKPLLSNIDMIFSEDVSELFEETESFKSYDELNMYLKTVIKRTNIDEKESKFDNLKRKFYSFIGSSDSLNEYKTLIVVNLESSIKHLDKIFHSNSLVLDYDFMNDLKKNYDFKTANEFINKYGMEFSFGKITKRDLKIKGIEIGGNTSYDILSQVGSDLLKKTYFGIIRNDEESENILEQDGINFKFKFFSGRINPLYQYYNQTSLDKREEKPIITYLLTSLLNTKQILLETEASTLNRLHDTCMLRQESLLFKEVFKRDFNLDKCKYFSIDTYWEQSIYRDVANYYEANFNHSYYSNKPNDEIIENMKRYMLDLSIENNKFVSDMVNNDIHFLSKSLKLENFLKKNETNFDMIIFYYDKNLQQQNKEDWNGYWNSFCDNIYLRNLKNNQRQCIGIVIDYDLHEYLKENKIFFKNVLKIEYNFTNVIDVLDRGLVSSSVDRSELNDIKSFENINRVDLSNNIIFKLDSFSFTSIPYYYYISELNLRKNRLKLIEPKTFTNFRFLEILDLSSNCLVKITSKMFDNLRSLLSLNLENNEIEEIEEESFKSLINLKILNLSMNNLEYLIVQNVELFSQLNCLEYFDLSRNKLRHLTKQDLNGLKRLKEFDLSHNKLKVIESDLFSSLNSLQVLNLSQNKLYEIQFNALNQLVNLKCLLLNNNQLKLIESWFFKDMINLVCLCLHSNCFSYIQKNTFNNMIDTVNDKFNLRLLSLFDNCLKYKMKYSDSISLRNRAKIKYLIEEYDLKKIKDSFNYRKFYQFQYIIKKELVKL